MTDERRQGPRAKKKFGQHFLNDRNIIRKIADSGGVQKGDLVLEIGPGTGVLTRELLDRGAKVVAIEVDPDLIGPLRGRFEGEDLTIIHADALKASYIAMSREFEGRFKLIANLPYYISGPLLSKLLTEREAFTVMVLMFQKEVAVRITAGPGSRDYGNLSVLSRAFTDVSREFDVPAHLFTPKPKVDSSVVRFRILDRPIVDIGDEKFFRSVVRSAFATRRKTLLNSLSALGLTKAETMAALEAASIDPGRRGETLELDEFSRLAASLRQRMTEAKNSGTLP